MNQPHITTIAYQDGKKSDYAICKRFGQNLIPRYWDGKQWSTTDAVTFPMNPHGRLAALRVIAKIPNRQS